MRVILPMLHRPVVAAIFLIAAWPAGLRAEERSAGYRAALESIQAAQLKQHVAFLADGAREGREAGTRGGYAAGDYVIAQLQRLGLRAAGEGGGFAQSVAPNYRNILASISGNDLRSKDEWVVACAHYDHVGFGKPGTSRGPVDQVHPGADDNASGTAALLELAEALTLLPEPTRRPVLLAFWDAEEKGMLGSKHWQAHPTLPGRVVFLLNMDMVGRLRERLNVYGTRTSCGLRGLVVDHNTHHGLAIDFPWTLVPNADHDPFFRQGIPVLALHTGMHEQYHRPTDAAALINHEGLERVARLAFGVIHGVARAPTAPGFREACKHETDATRKALVEQLPPLPDHPLRVGITWTMDDAEPGVAVVTRVVADTPAARAGLRPGDRILTVAGGEFRDEEGLAAMLKKLPGPIRVVVERDGQVRMMEIRFEAQVPARAA